MTSGPWHENIFFWKKLSHILGIRILKDTGLKIYSTLRAAGLGHVVEIHDSNSLISLMPLLKEYNIPYRVIGLGSNQILFDDYRCLHLHLQLKNTVEVSSLSYQDEYELVGNTPLLQLTQLAIKHKLKGLEVFTGIPGTLGGSIFMNAGTSLGEIVAIVKYIEWYDVDGRRNEIFLDNVKKENLFSYRKNILIKPGEMITKAIITHQGRDEKIPELISQYLEKRKMTQPLKTKNCGCTFKNPSKTLSAGKVLEDLNLKGYEYKGFRVSPIHANFIENYDNGRAIDLEMMIRFLQNEVKNKRNIDLEIEIKLD